MSAKSELFIRLTYLNAAVNLPVMIDKGIALDEHNGIANLLRKGLGIVAFNMLEDFIKNKSLESLTMLSSTRIVFTNLTESLQSAATSGALSALVFRSGLEKKDGGDWKTLVQEEALKIYSTKNPTFEFSKFSLVSSNSNISSTEVTDVIQSFGIKGGWNTFKTVSDKIGGGLPDLGQAYKNAADRRNNSAHSASYQYHHSWLASIRNEILTIAATLDILLSARCRQAENNNSKKMDDHDINEALNFRFLEQQGSIYKETKVMGGKSRKNWTVLKDALDHLQPNLKSKNEFLIVLNSTRRIEDWYM